MEELREEALKEGVERGRHEGRTEEKRTIVMHMLSLRKYGIEKIAEISGLFVDEIKELGAGKTA